MEKYFDILRKCPLFAQIEAENIAAVLRCLGARVRSYGKNELVMAEGEPARYVGVVLSGAVQITQMDYYGNRSIVATVEPSQLFGESFACAGVPAIPVDVVSMQDTTVMCIDCRKIIKSCENTCSFHSQMIFNLLQVVAMKNLVFHQRIEIASRRTTREKLMTYLLAQAKRHGSSSFTISFDRQALADYLGVDRSGLSAEIGKLRREGVLECRRKFFRLL